MKGKNDDKRWLRINTYVDVSTGEIIGHVLPKNYNKTEIIKKEYRENEQFRIIERTIGCREYGIQTELQFTEYITGAN